MQCSPKRWDVFNNRRGFSSEAKVARQTQAAKKKRTVPTINEHQGQLGTKNRQEFI
jgi:hypothetical protein